MTTIERARLAAITGGAAKPVAQPESLGDAIDDAYKSIACDIAGSAGADQLASQFYRANATDSDRARAAKLITTYCNAGKQLPAAAPQLPF